MGAGQGRSRRAYSTAVADGLLEISWHRWTDFLQEKNSLDTKALEYYFGDAAPEDFPPYPQGNIFTRLTQEILSDTIVVGALTLPRGIQGDELRVEIEPEASHHARLTLKIVRDGRILAEDSTHSHPVNTYAYGIMDMRSATNLLTILTGPLQRLFDQLAINYPGALPA